LHVANQLLYGWYRSSGEIPALFFAFNCENPSSVSLLSTRIDMELRKMHPFLLDDAATWTMVSGHCDSNISIFDLLES
jgi:hypothetical protein